MMSVTDSFGPMLARAISKGSKVLEKAQAQNAAVVQSNIIKGIRSQKYVTNWPSLSEATKKRKRKLRLSPLTLVAHGDYSSSFETRKHDNTTYEVGTNRPDARRHEFGFEAGGEPERPHVRPALKDSAEQIKENYVRAVSEIFE
ncbi:phage virion morphogenesis protein [Leptospira brenneri]|uniref:phage virion morphogenesis protein n=1 Tax=Leptospira brenneri TaxID=2023182 RepID=UPI000C2B42D5|nr:phage virion morphogenesis protein [Leptospira brenneri]PJZ43672.1 phage morphogenesis protein [Leptospira brenneri]